MTTSTAYDTIEIIFFDLLIVMNTFVIIFSIVFTILVVVYIFLYMFHRKLELLETRLIALFRSRTDTIPSIYEISKPFLTKHEEIFKESLRLKKTEFSLLENSDKIINLIETEWLIHHEINFIFKVCNKHPGLLKNGNFIYIREVVIDRSRNLWEMVQLYKSMIEKFNKLITLKNYSIIGLLLPISRKSTI